MHKRGPLDSVQDLGAPGQTHLGISPGGAADAFSLRAGNRLLGNADNAAALEMTLVGGQYGIRHDAWCALTGARWELFHWRAGERLRIGPLQDGARAYLCLQRTHGPVRPLPARPVIDRSNLRVTRGLHAGWFDAAFYRTEWKIAESSNRRGLRLVGPALTGGQQILTEGVSQGTIQVPPDGQPIILFVDQQTTGGYSKIANVISADLRVLGQLRPRDAIRFLEVTLEDALDALRKQEKWLDEL